MRRFTSTALLAALGIATSAAALDHHKPTDFGKTDKGEPVKLYTLKNANGMIAKVMTRGATLVELHVPDAQGETADVVLGFDDVSGYESDANQYFGCTVGRVCNRIGGASFELNGKKHTLFANDGDNTLHGGNGRSFDKVLWKVVDEKRTDDFESLTFRYVSPDGEEGFPGTVTADVEYRLTADNALRITYEATTDKASPVSLTNHAYFNLSGAGSRTVLDHEIMLDAPEYTPVDDGLIPTGEIAPVEGTPLDFTASAVIGARIDQLTDTPTIGYDHNFVLSEAEKGQVRTAAVLKDPESGRTLTVRTDQPGIQFYSGNFLKDQKGKGGKAYPYRSAVCLETQNFPDAIHHDNFPKVVLQPGETYRHVQVYQFGNATGEE